MLILDTDRLTLVQKRSGQVFERLTARLEQAAESHVIAVTIISFEEQLRGWLSFVARAKSSDQRIMAYHRLHEMLDDSSGRTLADFGEGAAAECEQLTRRKVRIGTMDLRIAAIALANGATLLSRNRSDFRKVPGLAVEDWTS